MKKLFLSLLSLFILTACTPADTSPPARLGKASAPVLIEEFSDFECPACAIIGPQLEELVLRNPDVARLEFHHYPLSYHKYAFTAAEAAECANEQGKFWEFAKLNFSNQKNLTNDSLKSYAKQLKLDETAFNECFDGHKKRAKIKADIAEGSRRQLSGTPSIYVNGKEVKWSGVEAFEAYVRGLK